jgi:enoyl reductase-like protein
LHEEFFAIHQLLYDAFEGTFPHPEAVSFQVKIQENSKNSSPIFDTYPEATLVRLLVGGLPDNNVITRLFDDKIEGDKFQEAKDILWQLKITKNENNELIADVISSHYWFKDLKYVDGFEAETHADE